MELIKRFFKSKKSRTALWEMLDSILALAVAFLAFAASQNIPFALVVLPPAQAFFQFLTKYLNTSKNEPGNNDV